MAQTVTNIQTKVRWEIRDEAYDLTDTTGLAVFNMIYRRLASFLPWPELLRSDTSLTTTSGTEDYTWPSSPIFIDVLSVEIQNPEADMRYCTIAPVQTFSEMTVERGKKKDFPLVYMRAHDGSNHVLRLAPTPDTSSLTVRITGIIEPTEVTSGTDTTIFLNRSSDDVLSLLIAADVSSKRGMEDRSQMLILRASELLSVLSGKEITPYELKSLVGNGTA